jgi:hypothetical protein
MDLDLIQTNKGEYIKLACEGVCVSSEDHVLALLGACGEHQNHKLLIPKGCLHPNFFNLKTGLAGLIFQKFSTYKMKTAFLGQWDEIQNERFKELMYECNKGLQIHFFTSTPEAERWLLA